MIYVDMLQSIELLVHFCSDRRQIHSYYDGANHLTQITKNNML